jgi:hypothetical protein
VFRATNEPEARRPARSLVIVRRCLSSFVFARFAVSVSARFARAFRSRALKGLPRSAFRLVRRHIFLCVSHTSGLPRSVPPNPRGFSYCLALRPTIPAEARSTAHGATQATRPRTNGERSGALSAATLRADLQARFDETEAHTESLPHRRKYQLLVIGYLRKLLELHLEVVDQIENELAP